jgi:two-component system sensor histidine kinase RpfC
LDLPLGNTRPISPSANSGVWAGLTRRYRNKFSGRPDTEHEQALIRLAIVTLLAVYLMVSVFRDRNIDSDEAATVAAILMSLLFSVGVFAHIAKYPGKSSLRKVIGMVHDNGMTAYIMYSLGEYCAPFYIVLLWVTFGNGFRFGRKYLLVSALLGTTFFSLVILATVYWSSHWTLGIGLLLGLIVLPAYVSSLLKKLTDAISRAEEANKAKNQFLANMSHEMRTPLVGVLGMIDLLRGTPLTTEQEDFANTIQASSQTLLYLIEDVLDFSKIEAGKISVEMTDFDLHALIKSTMSMVTQQAREKGLHVAIQIPSRIPYLMRGDPQLIRQILLNLLTNAVKFTAEGEICLRAERIKETATNVELRFEVSDTGIGISPEAQTRIFQRFTQADESITRRYGGTGLGTTIAKQLVELMGGEIGLRSEPGKGSTFWFTLSLEKQLADAAPEGGTGGLSGRRVLVISSDRRSTDILKAHLASWGVTPAFIDRASQAFSHLISAANDRNRYQVAIIVETDLDMDPRELAKAIRSVRVIQNVQLILVSKEENEPDLGPLVKEGFGAAIDASLDKTLLFNAIHFVRPVEAEAPGFLSLPSLYHRRKETRNGLRILVAEDNLTNQKVIAKMLERAGHRPHLVANGEEALDAMEREVFDIVLLDLQMPVMGGLEAAQMCHFTCKSSRPPLVALTADATHESMKACKEAGFTAYLTKPVESKRLMELIDSLAAMGKKGADEARAVQPASPGIPPAERGGESEAIDAATIRDLAALGDGDFLEKLFRTFLKTGEEKIDGIEMAMKNRNFGRVAELAHGLKGSAGQIGAFSLMELCDHMSRLGPTGLLRDGYDDVERLRAEFENVRTALHDHVKKAGGALSR